MMFLTVLVPLLMAADQVWGLPEGVKFFFYTHPWEGFTAYDLIMPCFIFMCGAAIPLSLERRIEKSGGVADAGYWKHVAGRFVMLWALGLLVQGRLTSFDLDKIRLYDNTLQTIAFGYLVCATTVALTAKTWIKIAVPAACFVLYGALLHAFGDYSYTGNFAFKVEKEILTAIVPATSETARELAFANDVIAQKWPNGIEVHYTWYLTSLMFVFMTFAGYFSTKILQSAASQWKRAQRLALLGASLLALGWILTFAGVRMVKHIFTVSFTAQAMGWSALLYAGLYVLTDIWKVRRGFGLCVLFGQFALTAYVIGEGCVYVAQAGQPGLVEHLFAGDFAKMFVSGIPNLIGTAQYQPLFETLFIIAVTIGALAVRRRLKAR